MLLPLTFKKRVNGGIQGMHVGLLMFITIDWKLTLIALAPMPLIALVVFYMGRIIHRKFTLVQEGFSILSDKVQESFAGIRVIKSSTTCVISTRRTS